MIAKLSDDLVAELERAGDEPLRVENPRNHKLYVIIAEDRLANGEKRLGGGEWTDGMNSRRFELVDKQIEGTISPVELVELEQLQQQLDDYLRRVAPLPVKAARELHDQLRLSLGSTPGSDA